MLLDIQNPEPVPVFQYESFVAMVMQGEGGEGMQVDEDHSDHEDRQSDHSDHDNDPENDREAPPPDNDDGKCFSFVPPSLPPAPVHPTSSDDERVMMSGTVVVFSVSEGCILQY